MPAARTYRLRSDVDVDCNLVVITDKLVWNEVYYEQHPR
jgi:hypothetical protein